MKAQFLAYWGQIRDRYSALQHRERVLLATTLILAPMLLLNNLVVEPASKKVKVARQRLMESEMTRNDLVNQMVALQANLQNSPDEVLRTELKKIAEAGGEHQTRLAQLRQSLVPPAEMSGMLEQLLARQPGLRLIGLRTLAPESLLSSPALGGGLADAAKRIAEGGAQSVPGAEGVPATPQPSVPTPAPSANPAKAPPAFDLYRHGVELKLEGSFTELHAYLSALERQEKRLLWGALRFEVQEHPRSRLTLLIYTLSTDKAWLTL